MAAHLWGPTILLVTHTSVLAQAPIRWQLAEAVRVGNTANSPTFAGIWDVVVNARGEAFVLDGSDPFIKIVSRNGRVVRLMGRVGSGPGEFRQPTRLGWRGDTLWVIDPALKRVTFFDDRGRALNTLQLSAKVYPPFVGTDVFAITRDGAIVVAASANLYEERPFGFSPPTQIGAFVATRAGVITRSLVFFQRQHSSIRLSVLVNGTSGHFYLDQPFRDDPLFEAARDGSAVVIVNRLVGETRVAPTFTVTKLSTMGDTIFSRNIAYSPRTLDNDTYSAVLERIRHPPVRPGTSLDFDDGELRQSINRPKVLPPVDAVILSKDGRTWLRRETTSASPRVEYLILGPTGLPEAVVAIPSNERVVEADGKTAWTITRDADDVPILSVYRILRGIR